VGGGCRGRLLAERAIAAGHAVRITTRTADGGHAIEAVGAESWVGTPMRLATLRGSLDGVAVACWLLGTATAPAAELAELFGPRLELFMTQAIDTTVRGVVYEAGGANASAQMLAGGEAIVRTLTTRNAIPVSFLAADPRNDAVWLAAARAAVASLLSCA